MSKSKICVGIVFGGKSDEHLVSIKSAKTILQTFQSKINQDHYEALPIYIDKEGLWWPPEIAYKVINDGTELEKKGFTQNNQISGFHNFPEGSENVEIWFPVIHGPNGEDGTIQGLFKLTGKPFVGSGVLGSALGMDKIAMKAAFASAGLPQVPYLSFTSHQLDNIESLKDFISKLEEKIGYPNFVKPANLGSSVGISKTHTREQLIKGLKLASSFDSRIVVEKSVAVRELECAVIGKKNLRSSVPGEIKLNSEWYDYQAKYSEGLTKILIPAPVKVEVAEKISQLSIKACQAISAYGLARVDFFYQESNNKLWINEINTMPGFTSQSMYPMLWEASGLNLNNLVAQLLETAKE